MNILDQIIAQKQIEIKEAKSLVTVSQLEQYKFFERPTISLKQKFISSNFIGVIAEHKRKSPSKGIINDKLSVEFITQGYNAAGAICLSILTDNQFFGGCKDDLILARDANPDMPILRKDFVIDEYQILEAKAWGADLVLLIAANLQPKRLKELAIFAKNLNLEVLMEAHDEEELLANLDDNIDLIGVNNRNLKTFEVSLDTSLQLADLIPKQFVKVAESGINSAQEIVTLYNAGFLGFLIGESFMKTDNPGDACMNLLQEVKNIRDNE